VRGPKPKKGCIVGTAYTTVVELRYVTLKTGEGSEKDGREGEGSHGPVATRTERSPYHCPKEKFLGGEKKAVVGVNSTMSLHRGEDVFRTLGLVGPVRIWGWDKRCQDEGKRESWGDRPLSRLGTRSWGKKFVPGKGVQKIARPAGGAGTDMPVGSRRNAAGTCRV